MVGPRVGSRRAAAERQGAGGPPPGRRGRGKAPTSQSPAAHGRASSKERHETSNSPTGTDAAPPLTALPLPLLLSLPSPLLRLLPVLNGETILMGEEDTEATIRRVGRDRREDRGAGSRGLRRLWGSSRGGVRAGTRWAPITLSPVPPSVAAPLTTTRMRATLPHLLTPHPYPPH